MTDGQSEACDANPPRPWRPKRTRPLTDKELMEVYCQIMPSFDELEKLARENPPPSEWFRGDEPIPFHSEEIDSMDTGSDESCRVGTPYSPRLWAIATGVSKWCCPNCGELLTHYCHQHREPVTAEDDMQSAAVVVAMLVCGLSGLLVGSVVTLMLAWMCWG